MKLLNKLERRFGRYAISNLMKYIVALYVIGLLIGMLPPYIYQALLSLDFSMIMKGQVWRLITFIIPSVSLSGIIFTAISAYFYYIIGNALEQTWGSFRFNLYFFSGIIFNILASLIVYLTTGRSIITPALDFICGSMFFAFAAVYPNTTFYMYFLIPIKAKYLAWFEAAFYIYTVASNTFSGNFLATIPIIVSFGNFLIFFFATRNYKRVSPSEIKRKAKFRKQMHEGQAGGNVVPFNGRNVVTRHKCAVCGRTELDDDQLEFRFCSKCDGNYEYCMDHLFTHEHVKK
ncbi:MAG TPA: hypothetical protein VN131_02755 [Mobilitalea sp.]|nr:hypothetical protein [Mobilitalea sp.]